jgi:hypothetical protein
MSSIRTANVGALPVRDPVIRRICMRHAKIRILFPPWLSGTLTVLCETQTLILGQQIVKIEMRGTFLYGKT